MSEFGEIYYTLIFLILALLQDEIKGVVSSLICCSMVLMYEVFLSFSQQMGVGFFETALAYDFLFFVVGVFLIGSRAGHILIGVSLISFLFNTLSWVFYSEYKPFIQDYYGTVNIILFEILLYGHVTTTKIYPWIKTKSKIVTEGIKGKINNFFKRQRGEV